MRVGAQLHATASLPPEKTHGTDCTGGWVGPTVGLDECRKSRPPTGTRFSDRPACREVHFNIWEDNIKMYLKK